MADVLKLTFLTEASEKASFNIMYPNRLLTTIQVEDAMNNIMSSGVIRIAGSGLRDRISAELVTITETPYNVV